MLTFKPWKIESVLQMLIGVFGSFALTLFVASGLGNPGAGGVVDHSMLIVGAISFHGVGLLWLNWLIRDHGLSWAQVLGWNGPRPMRALFLGLGVGVGGFFVCSWLGFAVQTALARFAIESAPQVTVVALQTTVSPLWAAIFAVFPILLAPVVEEIAFRGVMFPLVKQQFAMPAVAWFLSAFGFAAIHGNLLAFLPLTVLAVLLTWLYEATDNLLAPICAHAVFNAINFVLTIRYGALSSAGAAS